MFQIRIHGRGGQGVVSGAEMLSVAAFLEGRHAQAFPSFGSERMGAPVMAFCRIDDKPIRLREPVLRARRADHPGLRRCCTRSTCSTALRRRGFVLLNATRSVEELGLGELRARRRSSTGCRTLPATELALEARRPRGAQRGAARRRSPRSPACIGLESVVAAIREKFPAAIAEKNVAAATEAHSSIASRATEAAPCLSRSKAPARSPRRSRCAARR